MSEKNNLNKLRDKLYDDEGPDASHNESGLTNADTEHETSGWEQPDDPNEKTDGRSILTKLLVFCGGAFVLAAGFAVYTFGFSDGGISPSQVAVDVSGPRTVSAGETTNLSVRVTNNNDVPIQSARLTIDLPADTQAANKNGEKLRRINRDLGSFRVGESKEINLEAKFFGAKGSQKEVQVSVGYEVADSIATFSADRSYSVEIAQLPIALSVSNVEETATDQPVTLTIAVSSNATRPLENVLLSAEYPFGFSVQETSQEPVFRDSVFDLKTLGPSETKRVEITGAFNETTGSSKQSFSFSTGLADGDDATEIGTLFATQTETLALSKPFVNVALQVGGSGGGEYVVPGAKELQSLVTVTSNANSPLRGGKLRLDLSGAALNIDNVTADTGIYDRSQQTLRWNARTTPSLERIRPGEKVKLPFTIGTVSESVLGNNSDQSYVKLAADFSAQSSQESDLPKTVTTDITRQIAAVPSPELAVDTLYSDGPISGSGPLPPVAGEETTYVLHFTVGSVLSGLESAQMKAKLPGNVTIAGEEKLSSGTFSTDAVSGTITWSIPTVPPTGENTPTQMYLPVTVTPGSNQVGDVVTLLGDIRFSGTDVSADVVVRDGDIQAPTTVPDDIGSNRRSGQVQDGL